MMMDFDTDSFGQLLTDALRAGPGSPAWHDAVARLRTGGISDGEDFALLLAARETLESGKSFRQIRPGPVFTARVLAAVEAQGDRAGKPKSWTAPIIAILATLAALAAVALIVRTVMPTIPTDRQTLADLESQTFPRDLWSIHFDGQVPPGWKTIGSLTPSFTAELRPPASASADDYQGCGIVTTTPLPAEQPAAIEVTLRLADPTDQVIAQVFITDRADFSADRGISPHELTWTLQPLPSVQRKGPSAASARPQFEPQVVLPDGTFASIAQNIPKPRDTITIRIMFNEVFAVVQSDGKRLYAGPHQLSTNQPRFVGVRFLRRGDVTGRDLCAVENIRARVE